MNDYCKTKLEMLQICVVLRVVCVSARSTSTCVVRTESAARWPLFLCVSK